MTSSKQHAATSSNGVISIQGMHQDDVLPFTVIPYKPSTSLLVSQASPFTRKGQVWRLCNFCVELEFAVTRHVTSGQAPPLALVRMCLGSLVGQGAGPRPLACKARNHTVAEALPTSSW